MNWLPQYIPEWLQHTIFPLNRWLHVVCTTLLVGGTLFYEFVIPNAIEDLKEESQLAVLGKVRWFFRQVVIFCALILILTGCLSMYHQWPMFNGIFHEVQLWLVLHIAIGTLALIVGIAAMARKRASRQPLMWLRVNFIILLVVIFVADVGRHMRMTIRDSNDKLHNTSSEPLMIAPPPSP